MSATSTPDDAGSETAETDWETPNNKGSDLHRIDTGYAEHFLDIAFERTKLLGEQKEVFMVRYEKEDGKPAPNTVEVLDIATTEEEAEERLKQLIEENPTAEDIEEVVQDEA